MLARSTKVPHMLQKKPFLPAISVLTIAMAVTSVAYGSTIAKTASVASPAAATSSVTSGGVPTVVQSSCMACHGLQGISPDGGMFPNLAGQWKTYMLRELDHFKAHTRADPQSPIMWAMVAPLTAAQTQQVAEYFSSQKPASGHVYDPKLVAEGKKLYFGGLPKMQMPACMACHGTTLAGLPPFFPMLAGQKRTYVINQLTYFKSGQRVATHKGIMQYIATRLDQKQIVALAAYIRSR
ncbi:c-type cytochrome [Acidithiobacillus ferriphilus]|nr:c-type cytochrome [Acidithiobacillus ferriphilus]